MKKNVPKKTKAIKHKASVSAEVQLKKKKYTLPEAARATMFGAPGRVNPGRKPGSRNKFGEKFVQDFMADWNEHGSDVLKRARTEDPAAYLRVAASIVPKELNINNQDSSAFDELLDRMNDEELDNFIKGLASIGADLGASGGYGAIGGKAKAVKAPPGSRADSLH